LPDRYTVLFPSLETIMIRELASVAREQAGLARLDHDDVRNFIRQDEPSEMELLFLWHCCEELEHKAVVANMFAALGGGEAGRIASYLCASMVLEAMTAAVTAALALQLPRVLGPAEWRRRGGWLGLARQARRELGGVPRAHWSTFRRYLDGGFHPDDNDTAAMLAERLARLGQLRHWTERAHAHYARRGACRVDGIAAPNGSVHRVYSAAEMIDHAADLLSDSARLVHDNERR
jgi:predicted metal-dependent hydrolase